MTNATQIIAISTECFPSSFYAISTAHLLNFNAKYKLLTAGLTFSSCFASNYFNSSLGLILNQHLPNITTAVLLPKLLYNNGPNPLIGTLLIHQFLASAVNSEWPNICHQNQTRCAQIATGCFWSSIKVTVVSRTENLVNLKAEKANSVFNILNYMNFWGAGKFCTCMEAKLNIQGEHNALLRKIYNEFFEVTPLSRAKIEPVLASTAAVIFSSFSNLLLTYQFLEIVIKLKLKRLLNPAISLTSPEIILDFLPISLTALAVISAAGYTHLLIDSKTTKVFNYAFLTTTLTSELPYVLAVRDGFGSMTGSFILNSFTEHVGPFPFFYFYWRSKFTNHAGPNVGKITSAGIKSLGFSIALTAWHITADKGIDYALQNSTRHLDYINTEWLKVSTKIAPPLMLLCGGSLKFPALLPLCKAFILITPVDSTFDSTNIEWLKVGIKIAPPLIICGGGLLYPALLPLCQSSIVTTLVALSFDKFQEIIMDSFKYYTEPSGDTKVVDHNEL